MPWRGEQMGTAVELEACGQHMDQEAADELVSSQRHMPVKRVKPLAQAVNFGLSASGRPRSSQITDSGKVAG